MAFDPVRPLTRERLRTPRLAAFDGIVFSLLVGTTMVLIQVSIPLSGGGDHHSADTEVTHHLDTSRRIRHVCAEHRIDLERVGVSIALLAFCPNSSDQFGQPIGVTLAREVPVGQTNRSPDGHLGIPANQYRNVRTLHR